MATSFDVISPFARHKEELKTALRHRDSLGDYFQLLDDLKIDGDVDFAILRAAVSDMIYERRRERLETADLEAFRHWLDWW